MNKTQAEATLAEIAQKPKYYFLYDLDDSYAHEIENGEDTPELHTGGVEDAKFIQTGSWHELPTIKVVVEVSQDGYDITLTSDAYLRIKNKEGNTIAEKPYGLDETKFIMDIWEERFKSLNQD